MKKKRISIKTLIIFFVLLALAVTTLYPILFMVLNSFKTKIEYMKQPFALPQALNLQNYVLLFKQYGVLRAIINSLIYTSISIALTVFVAALASFAFAKLRFAGKEALFKIVTIFMMVPVTVLMIPTYVQFSQMGLINHPISIILFWFVIDLPYGVYMMTANLQSIPNEILEAAKIDGANYFGIFFRIVLPMGKAVIVTMIIVNFMWNWNDLLMPMLLLQSQESTTLTVAVATIVGKYFSNMPLLLSGLVMNSLPTVIIYLIFQKRISKGMIQGSIK